MSKDHSMIRRKGTDRRSQAVARHKGVVDRRASDSVSPREQRLESELGLHGDIDAAKIKAAQEGWDVHVTARDGNNDIARLRCTRITK